MSSNSSSGNQDMFVSDTIPERPNRETEDNPFSNQINSDNDEVDEEDECN